MAAIDDSLPQYADHYVHCLELPQVSSAILDLDDLGFLSSDLVLEGHLQIDEKPEAKVESPTLDRSPADSATHPNPRALPGLAGLSYFKFALCTVCRKKALVFVIGNSSKPTCRPCIEAVTGDSSLSFLHCPWRFGGLDRESRLQLILENRPERVDEESVVLNQLLEAHHGRLQSLLTKMTTCFQLCKNQSDFESKVLAIRILGEQVENLMRLNSIQRLSPFHAKLEAMNAQEQQFFKAEIAKVMGGTSEAKHRALTCLDYPVAAPYRKESEVEGITLTKVIPARRSSFFDLDESVGRPNFLGKRCRQKSDLIEELEDADLNTTTSLLNICTRLPF